MKVFSQLESAQIENVVADPTPTATTVGRVIYRTDIDVYKICDATPAWRRIVFSLDESISFVGFATTPGTNPVAGSYKVYFKTDGKPYYLDENGVELPLGGSPEFITVTKTTTATLSNIGEDNVIVDATASDFTITLPAAASNSGLTYRISKSTEANKVTIDANSAETIGGELNVVLASKDDSIIITCDGSNWYFVSNEIKYGASYTTNAQQVVPNITVTTIVYEDVVKDTHGVMNTSTGELTIEVDGWYLMSFLCSAGVGADPLEQTIAAIYVDGVSKKEKIEEFSASNSDEFYSFNVDGALYLSKDEVVTFRIAQNSGNSVTLDSTPERNTFSVVKI